MYTAMIFLAIGFSCITPFMIRLVAKVFVKFQVYANYTMDGASANSIIIITLVVFIFSQIYKERLIRLDINSPIYINAVYFALIFSILARENIIFFRFALYFYIFCLLLIPVCIKSIEICLRPVAYYITLIVMIAYHTYLLINNNAGVLPYNYNLNIFRGNEVLFVGLLAIIYFVVLVKSLKYLRMRKTISNQK
jgi:transmembrane protein EpsG